MKEDSAMSHKKDDDKPLAHEKHAAEKVDTFGPVPRVCDQNFRAMKGYKRFKIKGGADADCLYILAANEDDARKCYLDASGLGKAFESALYEWKKAGSKAHTEPTSPPLSVTELPD
jgi:hypothetical protein